MEKNKPSSGETHESRSAKEQKENTTEKNKSSSEKAHEPRVEEEQNKEKTEKHNSSLEEAHEPRVEEGLDSLEEYSHERMPLRQVPLKRRYVEEDGDEDEGPSVEEYIRQKARKKLMLELEGQKP